MRNKIGRRFVLFVFTATILFASNGDAQMLDRSSTRMQTTLDVGWQKIGTITPKNVREVDSSPWSLGCETLDRDFIDYHLYKDYLAPLGIKKIRLQAGWGKTERKKGVLDFQWLDEVIDDALKQGLEIWLETGYGNSIYEGGGGPGLKDGFPTSPEGLAAWDRWVEAMATRYREKVRDWAMWNEPDLGVKRTPVQIADFNIRTAEIIKRVDPEARIGALSLARSDPKFLQECLERIVEQNKIDLFEWVIYHGYTKNPDSAYKEVRGIQDVVGRVAPKLKLWQGENGCPSQYSNFYALAKHPWTELTQCKWNARRMLGDMGHDVISAVFTICDYDYHPGREINRKGLLKINDKTSLAKVKMAYYAVQNIVSVFDGTLVRLKEYSCDIEGGKTVAWFAYRNPTGKDYLVMWDGRDYPKDDNTTFPITVSVKNGGFTDPVWMDVITGNVYEIPENQKTFAAETWTFKDLPVYDSPTLIVDRNVVLPP